MVEFPAKEATNLYLYRQSTTPSNLEDDSLIKGSAGPNIIKEVDTPKFMTTGAGRFAVGSQFELVEKFFESNKLSPDKETKTYTKAQLAELFDLEKFYGWHMKQSNFSDSSENIQDYIERVYVWNSMSFKISDNARFVVTPKGERYIKNFAVEPLARDGADDNFDFVGGGFFASIGNDYLEPRIDPSRIGRTVDIEFINRDNLQKREKYTLSNYYTDKEKSKEWSLFGAEVATYLFYGKETFIDNLFKSGEIKFLDSRNRPIFYGTPESDLMSIHIPINSPTLVRYKKNGLVFIGGAEADTIKGGDTDDKLYGGSGNDTLDGSSGHDKLDGGSGNDTLYGSYGRDVFIGGKGDDTIDGYIPQLKYLDSQLNYLDGNDSSVYEGTLDEYDIEFIEDDSIVKITDTVENRDGSDVLKSVDIAIFSDKTIGIFSDKIIEFTPRKDFENFEKIEGTKGRDSLTGTNSDNIISDNIIIGLQGRDTLTGNSGYDIFSYTALTDATDIITNFEVGIDKIDLSGVLKSLNFTGSDPINEGYIVFNSPPRAKDDTTLLIDPDGFTGWSRPLPFIRVKDVIRSQLEISNNFIF